MKLGWKIHCDGYADVVFRDWDSMVEWLESRKEMPNEGFTVERCVIVGEDEVEWKEA